MSLSAERLDLMRRVIPLIPFNAYLGIELLDAAAGFARLRVPFRTEFIGNPLRPSLHGGVISTLIDVCGGTALWTLLTLEQRMSTIDLRVDYLLPGRLEPLLAEGRVLRAGKRHGVAAVRVFHESTPDESIAEGRGVYDLLTRSSGGDV